MASYIPPYILRRFIRFAIQRLDILDGEVPDLDIVDIDGGKRRSVELRDLRLRIKRIASLLHLPNALQLQRAHASIFRLIVTYSGLSINSLAVELDGVNITGELLQDEKPAEQSHSRKSQHQGPASQHKDEVYIPTTQDLAKSFLEVEPKEEREQIEAAMQSQSQHLQESTVSSGSDDIDAGIGVNWGVTDYLTSYMNGVVERSTALVKNINLELCASTGSQPRPAAEETQDVSVNIRISQVSMDRDKGSEIHMPEGNDGVSRHVASTGGDHRATLQDLVMYLVCDEEVFASFAQTPVPSSPADARSNASRSLHTGTSNSPIGSRSPNAPSTASPTSMPRRVSSPSVQRGTLDQSVASWAPSHATADTDRFADADAEEAPEPYHYGQDRSAHSIAQSTTDSDPMTASVHQGHRSQQESYLNYAVDHGLLDSHFSERSATDQQDLFVSSQDVSPADSRHLSAERHLHSTSGSALGVEARPEPGEDFTAAAEYQHTRSESPEGGASSIVDGSKLIQHAGLESEISLAASHHASIPQSSPPSRVPSSNSSNGDELAQSKLFSHEDAESMYMSAMGDTDVQASFKMNVPGAWDTGSTAENPESRVTDAPRVDNVRSAILAEGRPVEECETPRPGSRANEPSEHNTHGRLSGALDGERTKPSPTLHSSVDVKSVSKVARPLLSVDKIVLTLPWSITTPLSQQRRTTTDEPSNESAPDHFATKRSSRASFAQDVPGAFSQYAQSNSVFADDQTTTKPKPRRYSRASSSSHEEHDEDKPASKETDDHLSIKVGSVRAHIDISTSRVLLGIYRQASAILRNFSQSTTTGTNAQVSGSSGAKPNIPIAIALQHLTVAWYEQLSERSLAKISADPECISEASSGVLLTTSLSGWSTSIATLDDALSIDLRLSKFSLGYADSNILSFDSSMRMRTSVRDLRGPEERDIQLLLRMSSDANELVINTLPLVVDFDIQKFDETLSSFGGLSGMLELGNSMASRSTVLISAPKSRAKGVHFATAPPPAAPQSTSPSTKVNLRLGGLVLTVRGKSCNLSAHCSPAKIVSRDWGVVLKIQDVKLFGPHADHDGNDATLTAELSETKLEFLFAPQEADLSRLLSLITPSREPYENDDDILVDTLLRQRRKGSVLRATIDKALVEVSNIDQLSVLTAFGDEINKLSGVAKYLPEDDRPGLLILGLIKALSARVEIDDRMGNVNVAILGLQAAHIGLPSLMALEMIKISVNRNDTEQLVAEVAALSEDDPLPMLMARMVGDELEPTIKLKLSNIALEYRVPTILAALGLNEDGTVAEIATGIASSVATITGGDSPKLFSRQSSGTTMSSGITSKPLHIDILLRDSALGLNPRKSPSKGLFVFTNARLAGTVPNAKQDLIAHVEIRKGSLLVMDDINRLQTPVTPANPRSTAAALGSKQIADLCKQGYVSVSAISAAQASVKIAEMSDDGSKTIDVELKDELFVLETCADSTQTLAEILNGLAPPAPPSKATKYRTEVMPVEDMMASFTGDAFAPELEHDSEPLIMDDADTIDDELPTNLEFVGSFYNQGSMPDIAQSILEDDDLGHLAGPASVHQIGEKRLLESYQEQYEVSPGDNKLEFLDNYFGAESEVKGVAHKWDSSKGEYSLTNEFRTKGSPLKVRVRDMHIIWNLFDGYDWSKTRDTIAQAVEDVEAKAEERQRKRSSRIDDEDTAFQVTEDFLFNSVYISLPVDGAPGDLRRQINQGINDDVSETGSYATSTVTGATTRTKTQRPRRKTLKLARSRHHKITFELRGVSADVFVFPDGSGETQSSIDVRIQDFEIFDHVPSSTWKKFATYMHDAGERQLGRPMIHLELLNVKPVADLAASELVVKVTVLPLRLHVDQDALDFITRFFEFKDDTEPSAPAESKSEQPFIQRLEVETVLVKLDYKPKKINYAGIRSGHTTEFMNFFVLDGADIILRHCIVYGLSGFDKLHNTLNDIWMPDIRRNQLPRVLSGLAAVRPLVNVGSGVRDLVVIPMREYRKDGRIVRSIQKGAVAFAKTTSSELARLGAKIAIGTQNALQGAEDFLSPQQYSSSPGQGSDAGWEDISSPSTSPGPSEAKRAISQYADQPIGVLAGLRGAARSLERDLLTARDAIIAIPSEVMESSTAGGAAMAVARRAPTVILRPAVGVSKAVGMTLLGAGNALDKESRRRIEDKYKRR